MMKYIVLFHAAVFTPDQLGIPENKGGLDAGVQTILSTVFSVMAAVSILFIVIGGVKYTLSGGDASGTKSAKETIMYAVLGLVIALLAFGIVNFITTKAGQAGS